MSIWIRVFVNDSFQLPAIWLSDDFPRILISHEISQNSLMKFKRFLSIPILSVFWLLGFVYYITVFIFIEDWIGLQSSSGFLNALIFTFMASLCIFSFSVCFLTDPGQVPASYVPDVEESGFSDEETKRNVSFMHSCLICDLGFVFYWVCVWLMRKLR